MLNTTLDHNDRVTDTATKTTHIVGFYAPELLEETKGYLPHAAYYQTRCTRTIRESQASATEGRRECKTCAKNYADGMRDQWLAERGS